MRIQEEFLILDYRNVKELGNNTVTGYKRCDVMKALKDSLSGRTISSMTKSLSTSTPRSLRGRSLMWPTHASTSYCPSRYLDIVFALDGDSTIIIGFTI